MDDAVMSINGCLAIEVKYENNLCIIHGRGLLKSHTKSGVKLLKKGKYM